MDSGLNFARTGGPLALAPGLWRLGGYHLPAYLVRGAEASLVFEAGMTMTAPVILAQLDQLGVAPEEVAYLVVSHAHSDHATGQEALLMGLPRAELVMSGATRDYLARPATPDEFLDEDLFSRRALATTGLWPPFQGPTPLRLRLLPAPPHLVAPGDSLDLGSLTVRFLGQEGHAVGGLAAFLPEWGALLASDAAGFPMTRHPNFPLFITSYSDYLLNLARLADLAPELIALGHQAWCRGRGVMAYLGELADHLVNEHRKLLRAAVGGRPAAELADELFARYYHDELAVYPPAAIRECCELLVRRSLEST